MTKVIDANGIILGRLASYAAKQALLGENIVILNAEKAIVSGKPKLITKQKAKKLEIKNKATLNEGPYHYRRPDRFLRRSIRGMLPWSKTRGREAFKRVMVYIGEPVEEIKRAQDIDISKEKKTSLKDLSKNVDSYLTVAQICKSIGGKW